MKSVVYSKLKIDDDERDINSKGLMNAKATTTFILTYYAP